MKPIAKITFSYNGIIYEKGEEVKIETIQELVRLNEKGFIEPLSAKEVQNFGKKEESKKIFRKEEE